MPTGPLRRMVPCPTSRCQTVLPVAESSRMRKSLSPSCVVTNKAARQMAALEVDQPGSATSQATFSVLLQRVGNALAGVTLSPLGPRHWGQISVAGTESTWASSRRANDNACMGFTLVMSGESLVYENEIQRRAV